MANYYFLITAFPILSLESKPLLSFKQLQDFLKMNLTQRDLRKIENLMKPIDLHNLRAFWLKEPLDDRTQAETKALEEEILVKQDLPEYLVDYLNRYESTEDRLRYFSSLYASLYRDGIERFSKFLFKYYQFERELNLILAAFRAKEAKRDLVREMQFEDPFDSIVAEILAQKDTLGFTPPKEYEEVKPLFENNVEDPQKLNLAINRYRFRKIEDMEETQDFGINRVLAYVAKFLIVDELNKQNVEKGMEQLSQYE